MATKDDVENAKREREIRKIKRSIVVDDINAYTEVVVSKGLGIFGLGVGGLEWIDPSLLDIALQRPEWFAGVGAALLAGKSVLKAVAKINSALEK